MLVEHLFYTCAHENTQSAIVRKIQDKKKDSYVICSTVKHISNSNTFFSTLKNDRFILFKNILQLILQLFRCKTSRQRTSTSTQRRTLFRMFGVHSFVQIHTHRIMLCCRLIKYTFHRTMQTD